MKPRLLAIVGPTASGKTEIAVALSKKLRCEAVSCDSMQVYRRMPILTQAPSTRQLGGLKTHLIQFLDPSEEYSAARFRVDATEKIHAILRRKKTPLLVGGTGLYLRALLDGLFESEGPSRDESFRKRMLSLHEKEGPGFLHRRLVEVDAGSAAKIHANDIRRIVRALEVHHLTGRPLSEQKTNRRGLRETMEPAIYRIDRDRQELYDRIDRRVDVMMKQGLLKEVKKLMKRKLSQTASMALGYREMSGYLSGQGTLHEAVARLKQNTRNYAKRQLAWFRHEDGTLMVPVGSGDTPKKIADRIFSSWKGPR